MGVQKEGEAGTLINKFGCILRQKGNLKMPIKRW